MRICEKLRIERREKVFALLKIKPSTVYDLAAQVKCTVQAVRIDIANLSKTHPVINVGRRYDINTDRYHKLYVYNDGQYDKYLNIKPERDNDAKIYRLDELDLTQMRYREMKKKYA